MNKQNIVNYRKRFMEKDNNFLFGKTFGKDVGLAINSEVTQRNCNQLIVGTAGTGKSYNYMLSNLCQANHSAVVLDYSGSLKNKFKNFTSKGITIHHLDFNHPETSSRYNPFLHVKEDYQIPQLTECIYRIINPDIFKDKRYGDPWHSSLEERIMNAAIEYIVNSPELENEERTFKTLAKILSDAQLFLNTISSYNKQRFASFDISPKFKEIFLSMQSYLSCLSSPMFECFTERADTDNINIAEFSSRLTYLFVSGCPYEPHNKSVDYFYQSRCIDFLVFGMLRQMYYLVESQYVSSNNELHQDPDSISRHIHFYLDDFQYREIPNFPFLVATCHRYGIGFSIMVQDINQLKTKYSKDNWMSIPDHCDTQIFLGSVIHDNYDYFSKCTSCKALTVDTINGTKFVEKYALTSEQIKEDIIGQGKILVLIKDTIPIVCTRLNPNDYL